MNEVAITELTPGDVFNYEGDYFLVTDYDTGADSTVIAIKLTDGSAVHFDDDDSLTYVPGSIATVTIK